MTFSFPGPARVRHRVVLSDGLDGLSRLVCLLRQRRYRVLSLDARGPASDGTWVVTFAVEVAHYAENLLVKRVNRLSSVVRVSAPELIGRSHHRPNHRERTRCPE